MNINQLYEAFSNLPSAERRPYELYDVVEIVMETNDLKRSIARRREDILRAQKNNGVDEDGVELATLVKWLADDEDALVLCMPMLDFIGAETEGYVLCERMQLDPVQQKHFDEGEFGDWFCQKPLHHFSDEQTADRAEGFYNGAAFVTQAQATNK